MPTLWRRFVKLVSPQGIPWPASLIYNRLAGSRIFQHHYGLLVEDIASHCPSGRVLDVGTGPAWLLIRLHQRVPSLQLVGVDISPAMVEKGRANIEEAGCSASIEVRQASAESLPFDEGSFDAVVSTGSIHHWRDQAAGLAEVYRVLKPGGWGLIYDLVTRPPDEVVQQVRREFGRVRVALLWLHSFEEPFLRADELGGLAASTPFKTGQTKFVGALCCLVLHKDAAAGPTRTYHTA